MLSLQPSQVSAFRKGTKLLNHSHTNSGSRFIMFAQYTGITAGLSVAGAVYVNEALLDLRSLLPSFSDAEINEILSGVS